MLPDEIQEQVYKPSEDETYNLEVDLREPDAFEGSMSIEEDEIPEL
jgi:hypothetical protein